MDESDGMTMAQPSSVQREPSMEEILASIRRIIEDSETGRKDESLEIDSQSPIGDATLTHASELMQTEAEPASSVQSNAYGFHQQAPENIDRVKQPVVSSASIFSSIHEAEVSTSSQQTSESSQYIKEDQEFSREIEDVLSDTVPFLRSVLRNDNLDTEVLPAKAADTAVSDIDQPEKTTVEPHIVADDRILSAPVETQVSSSFDELLSAYEAVRRKNMADAAEEMLRPMLREWLDTNLPELVERLVREEIERISRRS